MSAPLISFLETCDLGLEKSLRRFLVGTDRPDDEVDAWAARIADSGANAACLGRVAALLDDAEDIARELPPGIRELLRLFCGMFRSQTARGSS